MFYDDTSTSTVSANARMRSFSLLLSDMGLTHAVFFGIFRFFVILGFGLNLSFRAGIHGTKTGLFSRKIKLVIFSRSFAKVEAAHSRPKKYAEGVRTLSTPGDAVKFLRFDGDTGNFAVSSNARKRSLSLPFSDCGLTQAVFY